MHEITKEEYDAMVALLDAKLEKYGLPMPVSINNVPRKAGIGSGIYDIQFRKGLDLHILNKAVREFGDELGCRKKYEECWEVDDSYGTFVTHPLSRTPEDYKREEEEAKAAEKAEEKRKQEEAEKKRKEAAEQEHIRKEKEAEAKRLAEEQRKKEQAISNKVAGAFGIGNAAGNSQGDAATGTGNQGSPFGNSDHGANEGVGGYGSFNLNGRSIGAGGLPRPAYTVQEEGRIVVNITVDPKGNVIFAEVGRGTNIDNASMRKSALEAARKAKFNPISGANNQSGTITYVYKFK